MRDEVGSDLGRQDLLALLGRFLLRRGIENRSVQNPQVRRREGELGLGSEKLVEVGGHVGQLEVLEVSRSSLLAVELVAAVDRADLGGLSNLEVRLRDGESLKCFDSDPLVIADIRQRDNERRDRDLPVDQLALRLGGRRRKDLDEDGGIAQRSDSELDRDGGIGVDRREESDRVFRHKCAEKRLEQSVRERLSALRPAVRVRCFVDIAAENAVLDDFLRRDSGREP